MCNVGLKAAQLPPRFRSYQIWVFFFDKIGPALATALREDVEKDAPRRPLRYS
jgi:hypothetical protein